MSYAPRVSHRRADQTLVQPICRKLPVIFRDVRAGYSLDPEDAYKAFRGRAAKPGALLRKRGLADAPNGEA